jgi:hypothetical protein
LEKSFPIFDRNIFPTRDQSSPIAKLAALRLE